MMKGQAHERPALLFKGHYPGPLKSIFYRLLAFFYQHAPIAADDAN